MRRGESALDKKWGRGGKKFFRHLKNELIFCAFRSMALSSVYVNLSCLWHRSLCFVILVSLFSVVWHNCIRPWLQLVCFCCSLFQKMSFIVVYPSFSPTFCCINRMCHITRSSKHEDERTLQLSVNNKTVLLYISFTSLFLMGYVWECTVLCTVRLQLYYPKQVSRVLFKSLEYTILYVWECTVGYESLSGTAHLQSNLELHLHVPSVYSSRG